MSIFFTSDTHFGHDAIRKHCDRPFSSIEEMDRVMVANWNAKVSPKDTVYHLGDFSYRANKSMASYAKQLNGTIHLVQGNHDPTDKQALADIFESVSDIVSIKIEGVRIVLCHYAMRTWDRSHHGSWHLYGHSHGSLQEDPTSLSFDIGVDCHDFYPLSFKEVQEYMNLKIKEINNAAG